MSTTQLIGGSDDGRRNHGRTRTIAAALAIVATAALTLSLTGPAAAAEPGSGKRINALVLGEAHGPVLKALKQRLGEGLRLSRSAKVSVRDERRHDLLIVDGDELSARKLARAGQLRRFASAGKWVLAIDVRPRHHSRAISRETGFASEAGRHSSDAFLFRRTTLAGEPRIEMVDVPRLRPRGARHHGVKRRRQARKRLAARAARIVHESVTSGALAVPGAPAPTAADGAVPAELQHVGWLYSVVGQATPRNGYWTAGRGNSGLIYYPKPGTQTASWTMNHSFDVYLDNGDGHPQGNRQIVTYALDGQFTPKRPAESFFHMNDNFQVGTNDGYHLEKGWWTGSIGSDVAPDAATDAKLTWQASEPQTPNAETQYTSGQSFEVGFTGSKEGAEINGSFSVNNEKSYSVPDWGVQNNTSGTHLSWLFSSRSPCDGRSAHFDRDKCFKSEALSDLAPQQPNELALGQAQVHTNGRWMTKGLLEDSGGMLNFSVATPVGLVDTYCDDFEFFVCPRLHRDIDYASTGPTTQTYSLDAAIVNPVPVDSLKLAPNPADGGELEKVTGTVTLEHKAPMDVSVVVYSDSKNAVVGGPSGSGSQRTITIAQGDKSGTFTVQTNDNNLSPGAHTTASITAFYADATTEQLRIERGQ